MARTRIDDGWIREIHGIGTNIGVKYTFCGALEYRYRHVAKNWNAETRRKHEREYNNIILPALKNHNEKAINEYTKEDYEEAIERIKNEGFVKGGIKRQYSDASINNFQNLIFLVVHQSSVYGLCENVLWGTKFVLKTLNEQDAIESKVVLKKSLTIDQERKLVAAVLSDIRVDGAIVALGLMLSLGLRNGEACALNYGDVKVLEDYAECYVAWIYKSTKIKSSELQSSGKTGNTGRIVPVPSRLMNFLKERKEVVADLIATMGLRDVDIDDLPICCDGWIDQNSVSFLFRCRAEKTSVVAHSIFERAGIASKQLAYLDAELSEGDTASVLKEKDPTAYLLRRNYATQMLILGLTYAEIQYLLGHEVEDAYESRNEFVDNERIYSMHQKLSRREILNQIKGHRNDGEICIANAGTTRIHISATEPDDTVKLSLRRNTDNSALTVSWFETATAPNFDRTMNILNFYHRRYSVRD